MTEALSFNTIHCLILVSLFLLAGCGNQSENSVSMQQAHTVLDVHHMPQQAPQNLQARLAWGLWNLDESIIESALIAGACPYTLAASVNGLKPIPEQSALSPYALILEGHLDRTYMEENFENIRAALDQMYTCIEYLIKNNISVDQGVVTLGSQPTMREFVRNSLSRLNVEKASGAFDDEGRYSLSLLEQIQTLINEHQPE